MKQLRMFIFICLVTFTFLTPVHAEILKSNAGARLQVLNPALITPIITVPAAGNVDVTGIEVICFQDDTKIHFDSDTSNTITVPAFFSFGIAKGRTSIYVYSSAVILVMK